MEMLKLGYKSCIPITYHVTAIFFWILRKNMVPKNLYKSSNGRVDYECFHLAVSGTGNTLYFNHKLS